eukprot:NODE_5719_length_556_cov_64.011834_g4981_i0.p1 GENE.NODE_5719_length_556_cov_64.011834_g4981_i0~~NODE_5719_length_556_cov_64.011834_g4981_i0.p1  ORF type:complete len:107 (+),score=4.50 NODE_5719_length_556_cov_64.011834_g4981_i0:112-432(+)
MHVRVKSIKVTRERIRFDGTKMQYADCLVGDAFGCCNMVAKNEQLDIIKEGSVITIRNAHSNVVQEHLRIEVDRWGKIEQSKETVGEVNTNNNLSQVEYELVSVRK